jgi:5,10-methylenetetrahydromethanopterin reductase
VPIYIGATGPKMTQAAGELSEGLLTPTITTPAFLPYAREQLAIGAERAGRDVEEIDLGCTLISSIDEDSQRGREGARELLGYYLSNKVHNIKESADVLLEAAGLSRADITPIADAVARGGAAAARELVTDEIMDKCKVIAGSPDEVRARLEEYRAAGCRHTMLLFWGEDRERQIELFADQVLIMWTTVVSPSVSISRSIPSSTMLSPSSGSMTSCSASLMAAVSAVTLLLG